jgi:hypothetical protein
MELDGTATPDRSGGRDAAVALDPEAGDGPLHDVAGNEPAAAMVAALPDGEPVSGRSPAWSSTTRDA